MRPLLRTLAALCLGTLWACGYADVGEGTGTLAVTGHLDCAYPSQQTAVALTLLREAAAVTDANVTLQDGDTHETLHVPYDEGTQQYTAVWTGYHRRVTWQIWSGADGLMARTEGPSRHTVAHPHTGAVLQVHDSLDVRWATGDGVRAEAVTVQVVSTDQQPVSHSLTHDGGQHQVAASALSAGHSTLTVQRLDKLVPLGAAEGSALITSYSVSAGIVRQ